MKVLFLFLFVLFVLVTLAKGDEADTASLFSFRAFMEGQWQITRSSVDISTGQSTIDESKGYYSLEPESEDFFGLKGSYFLNSTDGKVTNRNRVMIEFDTPNSGKFQMGRRATGVQTLFEFDFELQANGFGLSSGKWQAGEDEGVSAFYQFVAMGNSFVISVMTRDAEEGKDSVSVYSGSRILTIDEKTFWQQYGTMVMMGGVFIFNMFIQKKTRSNMQGDRRAPSQKNGDINTNTNTDTRNDRCTVEEVTAEEAAAMKKAE